MNIFDATSLPIAVLDVLAQVCQSVDHFVKLGMSLLRRRVAPLGAPEEPHVELGAEKVGNFVAGQKSGQYLLRRGLVPPKVADH